MEEKVKMSPHFQFYAEDFLTGTVYLTMEERGIYISLLAKQWTDGKIPKKRLALFIGFEWDNLSDELKSKFTDCGEYVINKRIDAEREKQIAYRLGQSKNGLKGGRGNKKTIKSQSQKKAAEEGSKKKDDKKESKKVEKPKIPEIEEFVNYAIENKSNVFVPDVELKYKSWVVNGWKTGGKNSRPIKNRKTTLLNSLPHIKENQNEQQQKISRQSIDTIKQNSENWNVKRN